MAFLLENNYIRIKIYVILLHKSIVPFQYANRAYYDHLLPRAVDFGIFFRMFSYFCLP